MRVQEHLRQLFFSREQGRRRDQLIGLDIEGDRDPFEPDIREPALGFFQSLDLLRAGLGEPGELGSRPAALLAHRLDVVGNRHAPLSPEW